MGWLWTGLAALLLAPPPSEPARPVPRSDVLAAMQACRGYDVTATANGARFHAEVVLGLVREAQAREPEGPPLLLDHEAWFSAYLERTGLAPEAAPAFARLAHQYEQDTVVDYRRSRVLAASSPGPAPGVAANVRIAWPRGAGRPESYSYEDERASPRLRVTNRREMSYRLLDFGDMVVYGEVGGLRGRPTSGVLGALFDLIGEVAVVESRMAIAPDGVQVSHGRGRKAGLEIGATVTVYPDGRAEKGVPADRSDLLLLEERLRRPLRLVYAPRP